MKIGCVLKKTLFSHNLKQIACNTKTFLIYGKFKFVLILKPKELERGPTLGSKFVIKIRLSNF